MIDLGPPEFVWVFRGAPLTVRLYRDKGVDYWQFAEDDDLCLQCTEAEMVEIGKAAYREVEKRRCLWRGELAMRHVRKRGVPLSDDVGAA